MVPIYAPPYPDQARTADFLDRECARIAQLEAELVSMDAVLDEALATSVEHVIFDDGGDGWYGTTKYPLRSLGALGILADGDWVEAPYITDEGIRLVQTGNIGRGHFRGDSKKFISPETFRQLNCTEVLPRDVLFSRLNLPIARGCLAPSDAGTMVASVDVAILRVGPDVLPEYVVALASTDRWLRWLGQMARGTTMLRIARSQLGRVRIPLPPLETQRAIANAFEAAKAATGRARAEISQSLAALSEYRDALITEAVTGRVDMSRLGEAQLAEAVHAASEGAGWEVVAS
jgi:type I restriction enzyme, S subunit